MENEMTKVVEVEGRKYEVVLSETDPAIFSQVYRVKKDGSRGMRIKGWSRLPKIINEALA